MISADPVILSDDELWYELRVRDKGGRTRTEKFTRFLGAVAWGRPEETDPKCRLHGAIVGGERADGTFILLEEFQGNYFPATKAGNDYSEQHLLGQLISWKDRFLVECFFVEPEPVSYFLGLKDAERNTWADGLTVYDVLGTNVYGRPIYRNRPEHWPTFRDYTTVADVQTIPQVVTADLNSTVTFVNGLIAKNLVAITKRTCPLTNHWVREPPGDTYVNPLFRAFIWLIATWSLYKEPEDRIGVSDDNQRGQARWW